MLTILQPDQEQQLDESKVCCSTCGSESQRLNVLVMRDEHGHTYRFCSNYCFEVAGYEIKKRA